MHELLCPSCNASSQYDLGDYLLLCPLCSCTFKWDKVTNKKEVYSDHFIVPNSCDDRQIKSLMMRWLKRIHHKPSQVQKDFYVTSIQGYSLPYWIILLEAHTSWKGLVKRQNKNPLEDSGASSYLKESGVFHRNYRWAVSARHNICETWGLTRLHEPKEEVTVTWDGFPLDSTYSRGQIDPNIGAKKKTASQEEIALSAYEIKEVFDFKFSNGLSILPVQVSSKEALNRAKNHVQDYHGNLARLNVDIVVDIKTKLEIAGIHLIHLPFWHVKYVYQPKTILRHFNKSPQKNLLIDGYAGGILKSELAVIKKDKLWINAVVCLVSSLIFMIFASFWHKSFFIFSGIMLVISAISAYLAAENKGTQEEAVIVSKESPTKTG